MDLKSEIEDSFLHKNQKHSGFPSPANDYIENPININDLLIKRSSSTFLMRYKGNEMIYSGIKNNAILVIDRSIKPKNNSIIVASIEGQFICRRILIGKRMALNTDCHKNKFLDIEKIIDFEILGTVTSSINIY